MNIPELGGKIKGFLLGKPSGDRLFYAGLILAVGMLGFGVGRFSAQVPTSGTASAEKTAITVQKTATQPSQGIAVSSTTPTAAGKPQTQTIETGDQAAALSAPVTNAVQGAYVASKKSDKYHLPWCSGAKRIAEENKIWFATKEEAEKAGFEPAGNCPGI